MALAVVQETCTAGLSPPFGLKPEDYDMLIEMLRYRRPHGSRAEKRFINRFLMPLKPLVDDFGNLLVTVGDRPNVLWSSHTDTVHRQGGKQDIYLSDEGNLCVDKSSDCLGADCTTGVWLMVQMIKAGKEGLYIFHRGEECGCLGSGWLAANTPEVLKDIDIAIAFDRFGTKHVITHQAHGRCCSDDFAFALARQLGNEYHPDDTGVYTDTNEYISLVSECTNIAVGYYNQHSDLETQNIPHLSKLLPALLALDPTALPVVRDPSEYDGYYEASLYLDGLSSMEQLVRDNPDAVAELLRDYGIDSAGLIDEIFRLSGKVTW